VEVISKQHFINEEIRERELRVVGDDGEQLGIMSSKEALELAETKQLDLVMIAPQAKPPVCRIMDYGKFLYEIQKKEKEAKKKQKVITLKEIRISPNIEDHDLNVKAKNAEKFLLDGDKVKVTVRFRGREADYSHFGQELLKRFVEILHEVCIIEKEPKLEGRNMSMFLAPKKA
jgi:translation initiation factor IF-3